MKALNVYGRSLKEHLFEALALINRQVISNGASEFDLEIRGIGANINKALTIAEILKKCFDWPMKIDYVSEDFYDDVDKIPVLSIKISVNISRYLQNETFDLSRTKELINDHIIIYPLYQILFDWIINKSNSINISRNISRQNQENYVAKININNNLISIIKGDIEDNNIIESIGDAIFRSGLCRYNDIKENLKKISSYDDVIVCLDTCALFDCTFSRYVLPVLSTYGFKKFYTKPNWVLLVIPQAVIQELEVAANQKESNGLPTPYARVAFRALQELFFLSRGAELSGVSLIITGNPSEHAGDIVIRHQFKEFIKNLGFYKGIYFLSEDRTNAAISWAEGIESIFIKKNNLISTFKKGDSIVENKIKEHIFSVPIGTILYETMISLGTIKISWAENDSQKLQKEILLQEDAFGDRVDRWLNEPMRLAGKAYSDIVEYIKKSYKGIKIEKILECWNEVLRLIQK